MIYRASYRAGPRCLIGTSLILLAFSGLLLAGVEIITILKLREVDVAKGDGPKVDGGRNGRARPNVLFILLDDWGYNDVSWNNPDVRTPNIEKLGRSGIILDRNYVYQSCTPSRAAFLTGKYTHRLGLQNGVVRANAQGFIPENEKLISERFKDIGYSTHMLGKWHVGHCNPRYLPTRRGFDTFYGTWNGYLGSYTRCTSGNGFNDSALDWQDQEESDSSFQNIHVTDLLKQRAVRIIENAGEDEPFFMYLAFTAPHTPIVVPEKYLQFYPHINDEFRREYLAMVTHVDDAVGEVIEALRNKGLYDNTIISLSADNGGEKGPGNNFPFRGAKASIFEGGTRVPGLITGPRSIIKRHGYINSGRFHITDWVPTLLSLAVDYQAVSPEEDLDGVDQRTMITHGGESARREVVYAVNTKRPQSLLATISYDNYKLITGSPGPVDGWEQDGNIGWTIADGVRVRVTLVPPFTTLNNSPTCEGFVGFPYNGTVRRLANVYTGQIPRDLVQLYDIEADPEERINLASQLPGKVQELKDRLQFHLDREIEPQNLVQPIFPLDVLQRNQAWVTGWC